jgi:hypothetical protein
MTHLLPVADILPCCGRNQWDTPLTDRVTAVAWNVTCGGAS